MADEEAFELDYGDLPEDLGHGKGHGHAAAGAAAGAAASDGEGDEEGVDLYGDLAGATAVSEDQESYFELKQRADTADAKNAKLTRQVELLQKKCNILTKQNMSLKKNISCLYKTAKIEMDRKDAEIKRLREFELAANAASATAAAAGEPVAT